MGEIGIAGIGLARGYLNRPDLTERAFVPDFLGIRGNPEGRIYRTGDLGRVNAEGEIEHHGRIDTQVKIRGYRMELTEIESVLLRVPGIAQAVVNTHRPNPDVVELVAYYSPQKKIAPAWTRAASTRSCASSCPATWCRPTWRSSPAIPTMPSGKADRKRLPAPSRPRLQATRGAAVAPADDTERELATVLGNVLGVDQVSVDGHFFDDLGASSLLMAQFNAAIRERTALPAVSMKDIYQYPTVRELAALGPAIAAQPPGAAPGRTAMRPDADQPRRRQRAPAPVGHPRTIFLCGLLQLLTAARVHRGLARCCLTPALLGSGWPRRPWIYTRGSWYSAAAACSASARSRSRPSGS